MINPSLPESAPFTPEQRGWLNGFLAGLAAPSRTTPSAPAVTAPPAAPGLPITLLWGSQTGNSEGLAKKTGKSLTAAGHTVAIHDLADYPTEQLVKEENVLIITSTYGDGEPPDNAADFHEFVLSENAPRLEKTRFAIFALGDSEYPDFCECGKQFDERLAALGAERLLPRVDADVEYDDPLAQWQTQLAESLTLLAS